MAVKKNKIAYHPDELSQKQIDEMFDRFALPLIQSSVTPLNGDYAHVISHILWICFILGKDINHELSNKLHGLPEWNHDFNINTITLCFVQMKASLTDSEIKCLRRYFSNPLNLHQLLHLYLDEMEAYRTKNSLPEAVTILTDAQIQSLYDRFSAPISKAALTPKEKKNALIIPKALWLRLVTKTDSEASLMKDAKNICGNNPKDKRSLSTLYFMGMKTLLTLTEVASLQQHYRDIKNFSQLMDTYNGLPLWHGGSD
jgi:hypothetical protein